MDKRRRHWTVALYSALGIFYVGSLVLNSPILGLALNRSDIERPLVYSVAARVAGALCCGVILASLLGGSRSKFVRVLVAWLLVSGVAVVTFADNLLPGPVPVVVWGIALAAIALHLVGALLVSTKASAF
jgi:low temperature requirement protein LtrA